MIAIQNNFADAFESPVPRVRLALQGPMLALAGGWVVPQSAGAAVVSSYGRAATGAWLAPVGGNRRAAFLVGKRLCDVVGAAALLVAFSPVMISTAVLLAVSTRGRPFFWQKREGFRGGEFWIWKFRTMVLNAEAQLENVANERGGAMFKNKRDPRVTRLGRFLRAFSIDEMPQLINVLRGDMSLVGPRPMVAGHRHRYRGTQLRRLSVKPGLTGLWQVSGRTELNFEQMVALDVKYVETQSLRNDLVLLARTPGAVFSRRGAC